MRAITTHKVNGCNDSLHIHAIDKPGSGGANHKYCISGFIRRNDTNTDDETAATICFQNGPVAEVGTNGLTHEALLAICIDRLQAFQKGSFACRENAIALTKLEEAMHWLKHRTEERLRRGVEGSHNK